MLKSLILKNLALAKEIQIAFEDGFNILTGETGAGKTVLTYALNLLMGQKANSQMVRQGESSGYVEAHFEIDSLLEVQKFLTHHGIEFVENEYLILKREIVLNGKSKSFLNHSLVPSSLIRSLSPHLIEMASQNETQQLRHEPVQLNILDLFGRHEKWLTPLKATYKQLQTLQSEIDELSSEKAHFEEKHELYSFQLNEIQSLDLKQGEEDELFSEYRLLATSQEKLSALNEIQSIIDQIPSFQHSINSLNPWKDQKNIKELKQDLTSASNELIEISFQLSSVKNECDLNFDRFDEIDKRLSSITLLKKKYGCLQSKQSELEKKLESLDTLDDLLLSKQAEISKLNRKLEEIETQLSISRIERADILEKQVTKQLQDLNMNGAEFIISRTAKERSGTGIDQISFFLAANRGEKAASLKERASGGELSRIFFALKSLFASFEELPILIFDEVDANIGGETATIVGEKLKELGKSRQVIAITHFPQVAKQADYHLKVEKREIDQRTLTYVNALNKEMRQEELLRMLGGNPFIDRDKGLPIG
ncbi:MAG: DNA repair protein RecN [Simkaniaceae bacterium]